jgi:hypothetical protein
LEKPAVIFRVENGDSRLLWNINTHLLSKQYHVPEGPNFHVNMFKKNYNHSSSRIQNLMPKYK